MDLFGTKRKRATQAAVDALRPMIAIVQHNYGLPPGFWTDEFVLGYSAAVISFATRLIAPDLSATDRGEVLTNAFTAISNMNGAALARQFTTLSQSPTPDFNKGFDYGTTSFLYAVGRLKEPEHNPHVIAVRKMVGNDVERILEALIRTLFLDVVTDRFSIGPSVKLSQSDAMEQPIDRLRRAVATVSDTELDGDNVSKNAALAAAALASAIIEETIEFPDDDDDVFVSGLFAFVFANYFSALTDADFELAAFEAVLRVLGVDHFDKWFNPIMEFYNKGSVSNSKEIRAIGQTCERWYKEPTTENFDRLTKLFELCRCNVATP